MPPFSTPKNSNPTSHPIPLAFQLKKSQILASLNQPLGEYTDHSPKGTVDAQIQDLIGEINGYAGFVTTSSCAGRVAVFVEGPRRTGSGEGNQGGGNVDGEGDGDGDGERIREGDEHGGIEEREVKKAGTMYGSRARGTDNAGNAIKVKSTTPSTSPGGKGGGRWLYVSHDPLPVLVPSTTSTTKNTNGDATSPPQQAHAYFSTLFNLPAFTASTTILPPLPLPSPSSSTPPPSPPQLIHLTFSPLILHIHCATLHHARPLLSAAINAGFRESGVQSLRILDSAEAERGVGVMVAVRTAGLGFETIVGRVVQHAASDGEIGDGREMTGDASGKVEEGEAEVVQRIVSEEYLSMCAGVVNERFRWNDERRERFRAELKRAMEREGLVLTADSENGVPPNANWEDKEERRRRKREEGLAKQRIQMQMQDTKSNTATQGDQGGNLREDFSVLDLG